MEKPFNARFLITPWQRARGAMFKRALGNSVLVFVYPHPAPRLFHTFFCPPLRMIVLDRKGGKLFDQVTQGRRFIRLPLSQLIIEMDPSVELSETDLCCLAGQAATFEPSSGAWQVNASLDKLLFALLREAVADLRRVHEAHNRNGKISSTVLREKFPAWERGQFTGSAGFLLDFSAICEVPEATVHLSRQLLEAEAGCLEEITAASLAGSPWRADFPETCLRCGKPAIWRPVLLPPNDMASETAWRYDRPENQFLLCRRCAHWLGWQKNEHLRLALVGGLWGERFSAWQAWHAAATHGRLPAVWDQQAYPLWPREFGGETWERGSGARVHAEPRLPNGVTRTATQLVALRFALNGRGGIQRRRGRGQFAPWQSFLQLAGLSPGDLT